VLAELMPAWPEQLYLLLTERFPTCPVEAHWQMAHSATELARSLATLLEPGWEGFKIRGLFITHDGGVVRDLWVHVSSDARATGQVTHNLRLDTNHCGRWTPAALVFQDSLRHATAAARQYLGVGRADDGPTAVRLFLIGGR
jgi:hypothetical protein